MIPHVTNKHGEEFYLGDVVMFDTRAMLGMVIVDIDTTDNSWGEKVGRCHWMATNLVLVSRPSTLPITPDWGL